MKAIVFDLDGTLVDTKYDMLDAGNLVFEVRVGQQGLKVLVGCKPQFRVEEQYYGMAYERRGSILMIIC